MSQRKSGIQPVQQINEGGVSAQLTAEANPLKYEPEWKGPRISKSVVYRVTIEGTYSDATNSVLGQNQECPYTWTFKASQEILEAMGFQSFFKNYIAPAIPGGMKARYPGYVGLVTYHITYVVRDDGNQIDDPRAMDYRQLVAYVKDEKLPIETDLYPEVGELLRAIKVCDTQPEAFKREQEGKLRKINRYHNVADIRSLAHELNPELLNRAESLKAANLPKPTLADL